MSAGAAETPAKTLAKLGDELPALLDATKNPEVYDPGKMQKRACSACARCWARSALTRSGRDPFDRPGCYPTFRMRLLPLVAALTFLPGIAMAEPGECDQFTTFCVPLPDLVGVIDFPDDGPGREAAFEVGQQFSEIENVWIEVEARVFAKEFDVCGTWFDPQPCVHEVQLLGFVGRFDTEGHPLFSALHSKGLSFGAFRNLEGAGTDSAPFDDQFVQSGFQFLFDGEGSLTLFWNTVLGHPDRIILNVVEPSGEIFSARLIIEGTPVPEPSAGTLAGASLLVLAGMRSPHRASGRQSTGTTGPRRIGRISR
jgi:hypothetical protein